MAKTKRVSKQNKKKRKMTVAFLYNVINGNKSRFLSIAAGLEHALESLIGAYYTTDEEDYKMFANVIFHDKNELTFSKKIEMFERFLQKKFPDFLRLQPDFINRLNRIRKLRNRFAHSINLTPEELRKFLGRGYFELGFIEEGVPKHEQVTFKEIIERTRDAESLLHDIDFLYDIVKSKGIERYMI